MTDIINPPKNSTQNPDPKVHKGIASHLKLVISNPPPLQKETPYHHKVNSPTGFTAEIFQKGETHYVLVARDSVHCLDCEIPLEIHEDEEDLEPMSVVCRFSNILGDDLSELIDEDEILCEMILIQFHMKLLKRILLFCADHHALNLLIYASGTPEDQALDIFRDLVAYEDKVPTITGTKTRMVVPITEKIFDKWIRLMNQINQDFLRTLWRNQRSNPSIREYLKSSLLEFTDSSLFIKIA